MSFLDFNPIETNETNQPQVKPKPNNTTTKSPRKTQKQDKAKDRGGRPQTEREIHEAAHEAGADLSEREFRLFVVMANPDHWGKKRQDLADLAGIGIAMAYEIPKREHFQEALKEFSLSLLASELPAIMAAHIATAKIIGKEGYGDRKMLFDRLKVNPPNGKTEKLKEIEGIAKRLERATTAAEGNVAHIREAGVVDLLYTETGVQESAQNAGLVLASPDDPLLPGDDLQPIEHIGGVEPGDRDDDDAVELGQDADDDRAGADDAENMEPDAPHPPHHDGPFPL